jgi:hypothetical protein
MTSALAPLGLRGVLAAITPSSAFEGEAGEGGEEGKEPNLRSLARGVAAAAAGRLSVVAAGPAAAFALASPTGRAFAAAVSAASGLCHGVVSAPTAGHSPTRGQGLSSHG